MKQITKESMKALEQIYINKNCACLINKNISIRLSKKITYSQHTSIVKFTQFTIRYFYKFLIAAHVRIMNFPSYYIDSNNQTSSKKCKKKMFKCRQ